MITSFVSWWQALPSAVVTAVVIYLAVGGIFGLIGCGGLFVLSLKDDYINEVFPFRPQLSWFWLGQMTLLSIAWIIATPFIPALAIYWTINYYRWQPPRGKSWVDNLPLAV